MPESPLTFGCVPRSDDAETRANLADLCQALSRLTQIDIMPHRAPSPRALATAFGQGRVQIAWTSPTLFLLDAVFRDAQPLVRAVRDGRTSYYGVLFATTMGPASLEELVDTRVAWTETTSASGYIFPRAALLNRGIDPDTTFREQLFANTHGGVAQAVFRGEADVGATFATFPGGVARGQPVKAGFEEAGLRPADVRVLLVTSGIPSDLIVVSGDVCTSAQVRLERAWTRLAGAGSAASALQHLLGTSRLAACSRASLASLRGQMQRMVSHDAIGPTSRELRGAK